MEHESRKSYELSPQKKAILQTLLKQKGIATAAQSRPGQVQDGPVRRSNPAERPLSFAQQRLWFLDQLEPGNTTYLIPMAFVFHGQLNYTALTRSLHDIMMRHEVLRSTIKTEDGKPVQHLIATLPEPLLPLIDLSHLPSSERAQQQQQLIDSEAQQPFDLASGPLIRLRLLRLQEQTHILLVTIHHIVFDGWSANLMSYELANRYNAYVSDQPMPLPELPLQYADYADWQQRWLSGERRQQQLAYWQEHLAGPPAPLALPLDFPRPDTQTARGTLCDFELSPDIVQRLNMVGQRSGTTLFMVLLAAFEIVLFRYSGQTDFVVGTPVANRAHTRVEGLIGLFVNTLALRADLSGQPTVAEVLRRVRSTALSGYSHQDIPFEQVVEALQLPRDISRPPLFQVLFSLAHSANSNSLQLHGLRVEYLNTYTHTAKVDLTLFLEEQSQGLKGSIEYNADLFTPATISGLSQHYQHVVAIFAHSLEQPISHLELLHSDEQARILSLGRSDTLLVALSSLQTAFEAQVRRTPSQHALSYRQQSLTYAQLNQRSNQLAQHLIQRGIGPGQFVGIYLKRSPELVIALLGVIKTGAAYVPLDPSYPAERLSFILNDTRASALLIRQDLLEKFHTYFYTAYTGILIPVEHAASDRELPDPPARGSLEDTAYVIYTSGSTGQPKGVMVSRRNVLNTFAALAQQLQPRHPATWLAITSCAFDISVIELLWTFIHGFHVILQDELQEQASAYQVAAQLRRYRVTHLQGTPAYAQLLLADADTRAALSDLDCLVLGGEAFSAALAAQLKQIMPQATIMNGYGPTETTIYATLWPIKSVEPPIPIGTALANTSTYVLDSYGELVPIGVPGELFIGGAGVAMGYLHRPDLTAERFVPDPFSQQPGARMYRTGDQVRLRADGVLAYLGRLDQQVKLNGYRIEPGEIEHRLNQHPLIQDSVVLLREDRSGDKRLIAYLVARSTDLSLRELHVFLGAQLPSYMLPAHFVYLDALPLTTNGKVDRRALAVSEQHDVNHVLHEGMTMPHTSIEIQLAQIWEELLRVHPISLDDNFFTLGGHSLLAVRLVAQVQARFSLQFPLSILFQAPTIRTLADTIQQRGYVYHPLVQIQAGGGGKPFFCIHPIGGEIFCYVQLAQYLGSARPVYAIPMPDFTAEQGYLSIEQLAERYLSAIQQMQPDGPYLLGGWSLGGIIAFEMAQRLRHKQQSVALLALIDSDAPILHQRDPLREPDLLFSFARDLSLLFGFSLPPFMAEWGAWDQQRQLQALLALLQQKQLMPSNSGLAQIERLFRAFKSNVLAVQHYHPQAYAGPVALFNAIDRPAQADQTPDRGWGELISLSNRTSYQLPGTHYSMLQPPQVGVLARQLAHSLEEVTQTDSGETPFA